MKISLGILLLSSSLMLETGVIITLAQAMTGSALPFIRKDKQVNKNKNMLSIS